MTPISPSKLRNQKKVLYHCDRCGELFKAPVLPAERVICNVCGNPPMKALQSNVDAGELAVTSEELAKQQKGYDMRRDVADFVGIKKERRGKQLKMAFAIWMGLLLLGGGVGLYYKGKQEQRAAREAKREDEKDYDVAMYKQRTRDALHRTRPVILGFIMSPDNNTRSEYVMDGVDLLVPMREYYQSHPPLNVEGSPLVAAIYLDEEGEYPRLDTLMEDEVGKRMEVVYWQKEGEWFLDWAQLIRYSDTSWNTFLLNQEVGSKGNFRLYVRGSSMRDRLQDDTLNLIFYEPKVFDGERGVESPVVELNPHTDLGKAMLEALEKVQQMKPKDAVLGKFDPPGWARVNVKLAWEEGEGGKPVLKLKYLYATHWLTLHGEGIASED